MPMEYNQQFQDMIDQIIKNLSSSNGNLSDVNKATRQLAELLRNASLDAVDAIKKNSADMNDALKSVLDQEIKNREEAEKRYREAREKEIDATEQKQAILDALNSESNNKQKEYLQQKAQQLDEDIRLAQEKQAIEKAYRDGDKETYARLLLQQELRIEKEKQINATLAEETEKRKKFINTLGDLADSLFGELTKTYTSAIDRVTQIYNQEAGNMSALLNTTVSDISALQHKIADELRSDNLSRAISNVAVMTEAASLTSAGYTDQSTLQQNAIDIAIGKELAPNVDFNNATVKSLINIFGSDFTHKFTAIQQAAQETAGSAVNISNNLSTLMTNLEPVYQNAQYQAAALQGTADVTATIANAREQGIITQAQEKEYMSMLTELMDPSKAFKSSNLAVKVAATQYDYGSGNPAEALQALISAQQQYYGNFDQSNSYMGNISRSLGASVAGNDTMSATYNAQGLTGMQMLSASNLDETYNEQLSKLQSGSYTTASEAIANSAENSPITQSISDFAKTFPRTFNVMQSAILGAIRELPSRLIGKLGSGYSSGKSGSGTSIGDAIGDAVDDVDDSSSGGSGGLASAGSGGGLGAKIRNSNIDWNTKTFGKDTNILNRASRAVGGRTGGLAMMSYGAGISGAIGVGTSLMENGVDNWQGWGMGGDVGASMTNYAGIGAAIGSIIAPGIGTAIGGLIGAIGGLGAAMMAQSEIEAENNRLMEEQNALTKSTLGEGVTGLTAMQAKSEIARGGGTIELSSGTYALDMNVPKAATGIDFVPYDNYLVKLHRGESVVTASAAQRLRDIDPNFWHTPNVKNDDVVFELQNTTNKIVSAINGDDKLLPMTKLGPKTYSIRNATI